MGTEVNPFMVGDDVRLINQVSGWSRDEGIITSISFDGEFIRFQYRVFGYRYELYELASVSKPLTTQVGGSHYKSLPIQPIEFITKNNLGWCEGNIIKYTCRWKQKGGIEDIDKVIHYAEILKGMQTNVANNT